MYGSSLSLLVAANKVWKEVSSQYIYLKIDLIKWIDVKGNNHDEQSWMVCH